MIDQRTNPTQDTPDAKKGLLFTPDPIERKGPEVRIRYSFLARRLEGVLDSDF